MLYYHILDEIELFETSAFENIKNSGVLVRLDPETQRYITQHYKRISWVNRQIKYREHLRAGAGRAMQQYSDRRNDLDILILYMISMLQEEGLSDDLQEVVTESGIFPTINNFESIITFNGLISQTESRIENHRLRLLF